MSRWRDGLYLVPIHMHDAVTMWIEHGIPGGDFLRAVMSNDLEAAVGRADIHNQHALVNWVKFLYNYAPYGSHGSREMAMAWQAQHGLSGLGEAEAPE